MVRLLCPKQRMVDYKTIVGKKWDYGTQDCYTLLRQYYALLGISLPDFERPEDLESTDSIFLRHAKALGFRQVDLDERTESDVLLMRLGTRTPMHAAIYLPGNRILHQRTNSLSAIEPLRSYYWKRISAVFRHAACHAGR